MVHALFGFQGRLTRLAYLGWFLASLVLMVAITAAFLAIGAGAATVIVSRAGPTIMGVLMALTVLVFGVWTGLALHTKRIRDTGFSPLLVIGSVMVIFFLDAIILTRLTDIRFFWPFQQHTPLGGLAGVAYLILLLFWPSSSDDESDRTTTPTPSPVAPMTPIVPPPAFSTGPRQFGRRRP